MCPRGPLPLFPLAWTSLVSFSCCCAASLFSCFCRLFSFSFTFISPARCSFSSPPALVFLCFFPVVTSLLPVCLVLELPVNTRAHGVTLLEALKVRGPLPAEKLGCDKWREATRWGKCSNCDTGRRREEKMGLWCDPLQVGTPHG